MEDGEERQIARLSSENRKLIASIAASIGRTADEIWGNEYDRISPDYARGYLDGFVKQAGDEIVLMVYFLTRLVE